ncbi:MAG: hypothetical protein U0746_21465 [Gemmataceae bacterium]
MPQPAVPPGRRTPAQAGMSAADAARIQNAANRRKVVIHVVGSRAMGPPTVHPLSDWDYVVEGSNSRTRSRLKTSLPRGVAGGDLGGHHPSGIDLMHADNPLAPGYNPLDPQRPHVTFVPQPGPTP